MQKSVYQRFRNLAVAIILIMPTALAENNAAEHSTFESEGLLTKLDPLDRQLVVITGKSELTEQVVDAIHKGLALLPARTKQKFIDFGVKIAITPTLSQLTGDEGASEYEIRNKRVIICERGADGSKSDISRLPITVLHELGHAYDHMLGFPSRKEEFKEEYQRDLPGVPEQHRGILSHFLQPGQRGPSECFASLFACLHYQGSDRRLTALKADFPNSFALMQRRYQ